MLEDIVKGDAPQVLLNQLSVHPEYYGSLEEKLDRVKYRTSFQHDELHTNDRFG